MCAPSLSQGKITIINAAKLLNKSRRTIERYLQQYHQVGVHFVLYQITGKGPANKTSDILKYQAQALIKEKCFNVNLQHLTVSRNDLIIPTEMIFAVKSRSTLIRLLSELLYK